MSETQINLAEKLTQAEKTVAQTRQDTSTKEHEAQKMEEELLEAQLVEAQRKEAEEKGEETEKKIKEIAGGHI